MTHAIASTEEIERLLGQHIEAVARLAAELAQRRGVIVNQLRELYEVERKLSLIVQPGTHPSNMVKLAEAGRDELRRIMWRMGWKGQF